MTADLDPVQIRRLTEALDLANVDAPEVVAIAETANERLGRIRHEWANLDATDARRSLVQSLAVGDISLAEAAVAAIAIPSDDASRDRAQRLTRQARDRVMHLATTDLRQLGPDLFTYLADIDRDLLAEAVALAPSVDGITDDEEAMKAPTVPRKAWGELVAIIAKRKALVTVTSLMRACLAIDPLHQDVPGDFLAYARPDNRPKRTGQLHEVRRLIARIDADTGPGLYSASEATRHAVAAGWQIPGQVRRAAGLDDAA